MDRRNVNASKDCYKMPAKTCSVEKVLKNWET